MAEDFDVEAMLEAPYMSLKNGVQHSTDHKLRMEDDEITEKRRRSRSKERSKKHKRSSSRSRSTSRSKESSKKRDRSRDRRRRSRSRERKRRRSRERSRSRDRYRKKYDDRYDDRHSRKYRDEYSPKKRSSSYHREDRILEEADRRTVFCMQLCARVTPRDLEDFFTKVGKVREVRLIMDNKTRKHKGIAYIEFRDSSSVPLALQLNGQKFMGYPISIQPTNAEKNKSTAVPSTKASPNNQHSSSHSIASSANNYQSNSRKPVVEPLRLYVGSLHFNVNEDMLRSIFEPFGTVTKIELMRDTDTLRSKGYGFITFANSIEAKKALEQMNGYELAGRSMKVNYTTERGPDGVAVSSSNAPTLDSDELDRSGIDLGAKGRLQLMAKLAEGTGIELPKAIVNALNQYSGNKTTETSHESAMIPTQCFMLTNLFDPETEEDEDWPDVIKEEVLSECRLHGGAVHVFVDTKSQGNVYIKATNPIAANKIVSVLHGRYFSGKMVSAAYVPASSYHQLFPDSLSATQLL